MAARTAYEEALASGNLATVPSYIKAGDTLNAANNNPSFLEGALDTIESIPKFIGVSLISGANQLYNIPADIGNLVFDGDFERSKTEDVINALDDDLGQFYTDHKQGADLAGFIVSSLVPGLGGVKLLKAGQASLRANITAGKYSTSTGRALGLLAPTKKIHLDKAIKEMATSSSAVSITQGSALRAIGAGLGQNTLEALAFETATALTLFNSPILENQDFGDFVSNVAWGAGVFGIVGGVIDGAVIRTSLKKAKDVATIEARPWTSIPEAAEASSVYERVAIRLEALHAIPAIPEGLDPARKIFLEQAAKTKVDKLNNFIRTDIGELAKGDQVVATALFQTFKGATKNDAHSAFLGLDGISGVASTPANVKRAEVLTRKQAKGTATLAESEELANISLAVTHTQNWGERAGAVLELGDNPIITQLADTLKRGQVIKVSAGVSKSGSGKVTAGAKSYSFNTHANTGKSGMLKAKPVVWNPLKTDVMEANARYIWAAHLPKFEPTALKPLKVDVNDIPLMEKIYLDTLEDTSALAHVEFTGLKGSEFVGDNLHDFIGAKKVQLANRMLDTSEGKVVARNQDEIAAIVNVKSSMLAGDVVEDSVNQFSAKDIFALQDHTEQYAARMADTGASREAVEKFREAGIWSVPQHTKLVYETEGVKGMRGMDNFVAENMVIIKEQQKLYQEATSRAALDSLGAKFYQQLPDIDSGRVYVGAKPSGAGAGLVASADGDYGTLAAAVTQIGNVTSRAIRESVDSMTEAMTPLLYKLGNSQKATIEWSTLNARVRSIEGEYGLNAAGDALEPIATIRWRAKAEEASAAGSPVPKAPILPDGMEAVIPLVSDEVKALAKAHIEINGTRTGKLAGIRTSQGAQFNRAPDAFYPIPIDPKEFPHFAIVTDESITSGNHARTLYAATEEELAKQISKVKQNPHLRVRTKREAEEYYNSIGQWDYEKTISNNYLDTEMVRKGISAPHFVPTDPQKVTADFLKWHQQRETGLVREAIGSKYEVQFNELRRLGEESTNIATSKFGGGTALARFAEDASSNPYADYIKTALSLRKSNDYPMWTNVNRIADEAFSKMFSKVDDAFSALKEGEDLVEVNKILKQSGYKGAAYDESMSIFANASPAKGLLTASIQKANSLLATVVLRWDPLNAANNAISANVLLGAETKAVVKAIMRGDSGAVGELTELAKITVPGSGGQTVLAPEKLIANSIRRFNRQGEDFKFYKDNGFMTSISDQYRDTLEDLTFAGNTNSWATKIKERHLKLKALGDAGEKWTGNKLAEEFNRFVAADVMKQLTDVAVKNKLMDAKEQLAYINIFVNRTQGNYLASQRPMLFQGPIGQAIGLFQTYQFNLIQQLLRHTGEGRGKDAMTLLALQGTIHGMNGLPAFNAINTHIVGNASGNKEHVDAHQVLYGAVGKEAGDWIMYGMASNALGLIDPALKVNLYTRGDINPRHVTLIPTNPADVPAYSAATKVIGNLVETVSKLANGGAVLNTILQGIEHNGLSRPLAGLAQTLQGLDNPEQASYSTSNRGNVIGANDMLSLTSLARVVGGKPLDEAIAIDAVYRYKTYALRDSKKRNALGEAIKTNMLGGKDPTQEQIEDFAEGYAKYGGKQKDFAGWMSKLYKTANLSQVNKLQRSLNSPFAQSMQVIMGGKELRDFSQPDDK